MKTLLSRYHIGLHQDVQLSASYTPLPAAHTPLPAALRSTYNTSVSQGWSLGCENRRTDPGVSMQAIISAIEAGCFTSQRDYR
jgi:hypothetical protein